jgi:hypothetical protein
VRVGQPRIRVREQLVVADPERLDPPLLPECQRNEEAQLYQLRLGEVPVEFLPESVVREARVPDDRARVCERGLLAIVEPVRV